MTFDEIMALQGKEDEKKPRKRSSYDEHALQCSEVRYMRGLYPQYRHLFFCVPNGQKRTSRQTSWLKEEGLMNGVSDMLFLKPNSKHGYLCIENKTKTGKQSDEQKEFQEAVEKNGGLYVIIRSFDEFTKVIDEYLNGEI